MTEIQQTRERVVRDNYKVRDDYKILIERTLAFIVKKERKH